MANNIKSVVHFSIVWKLLVLFSGLVYGKKISISDNIINDNPMVRTTEAEGYERIDCIDIYKQPAFDHPLLRNHKIQMKPNAYPNGMKTSENVFNDQLSQNLHKKVNCPEGTIPILREEKQDILRSLPKNGRKHHHTRPSHNNTTKILEDDGGRPQHEYATVTLNGGEWYGAEAKISVWSPKVVSTSEFSLSQIWVNAGENDDVNTIEAGWTVFDGSETRLFLYWTSDNYRSTGCYNLDCPGFVQTNKDIAIASPIQPVSTYNGEQVDLFLIIFKDNTTGNWWIVVQGVPLGYWPNSIFTALSKAATGIEWGGEIVNTQSEGTHTTTQMGSGHFPSEGYRKSSYFRNLGIVDETNTLKDPSSLVPVISKPSCYDLQLGGSSIAEFGSFFYYGGPGFSENCP